MTYHLSRLLSCFFLITASTQAAMYFYLAGGSNAYLTKHIITNTTNNTAAARYYTGGITPGVSGGIGYKFDFDTFFGAIEVGASNNTNTLSDNEQLIIETTNSLGILTKEKQDNPLIAQLKLGYCISKRMSVALGYGLETAKYLLTYDAGTSALTSDKNRRRSVVSLTMDYAVTPFTVWYTEMSIARSQKKIELENTASSLKITPKSNSTAFRVGVKYLL